ncbi:tetratricopeptide repeat protein [Paludisphaera soli]|uniref:tetratricopeptide repeat protein n=1 Tax=Paludisphaera soli TaxID=2712865 RepID=UPI0013EB07B5|nr:tetratricopeptide repeat protein [Paludisphaera soli]
MKARTPTRLPETSKSSPDHPRSHPVRDAGPDVEARRRRAAPFIGALILLLAARVEGQTAEQAYQDAIAWSNQGRNDHALALLDRAIGLAPAWWPPYLVRGDVRSSQGLQDLAVADLSRVIELDPSNGEAFVRRAKSRRRQDRYDLAIADLNRSLQLVPSLVPALMERAEILSLTGNLTAALDDADEAVRLDPSRSLAYQLRAIIRNLLGRHELALADLDRAIELDPDNEPASWTRSRLRSTCPDPRVRNGPLAYRDALRVRQLGKPEDPGNLMVLAAAYAECGDFAHAVEYQKRALAGAPDALAYALHLRECLEHYEAKQPCREKGPSPAAAPRLRSLEPLRAPARASRRASSGRMTCSWRGSPSRRNAYSARGSPGRPTTSSCGPIWRPISWAR